MEFTIYTETDRPGTAEVPPYVVGDPTTWTLRFERPDGTLYTPSGVNVRVGHVTGLADGASGTFKWVDRTGIESVGTISVTSGVPSVSFSPTPEGGVVGSNGVYLVRGGIPDGIISGFTMSNDVFTVPFGQELLSRNSDVEFFVDGTRVAVGRVNWLDADYFARVKVISGGTGYTSATTATFSGGGGTGMTADVVVSSCGSILAVNITDPGCGYTTAPTISFSVGTGADAVVEFLRADTQGGINSVAVASSGSGYTSAPAFTVAGGGGSGLELEATGFDSVSQLVVTNFGSGYTSAPTVTIAAPVSGTQATAVASSPGSVSSVTYFLQDPSLRQPIYQDELVETLSLGAGGAIIEVKWVQSWGVSGGLPYATPTSVRVLRPGSSYSSPPTLSLRGYLFTGVVSRVSLTITNPGSGYTSAPTVSFSDGGGSGLAATAVIGRITGVNILNPGQGYSSAPTITSSGGGATTQATFRAAASSGVKMYRAGVTKIISRNAKPVSGTPYATLDVRVQGGSTTTTRDLRSYVETIDAGLEKAELPYKRDESSVAVVGAVRLSGYSDGRTDEDGRTQYDHSALVVLPRQVASANFTAGTSGGDPVVTGTLNPVNSYVTARLATRRTVVLDLQVFGDGRMLFQGALAIVNKIV